MSETQRPRHLARSIGAILAGFVFVFTVSLGTDELLHIAGVFPPWGASMVGFEGALLLATVYRILFGIARQLSHSAAGARPPHATRPARRLHRFGVEHPRRPSDLEQRARLRTALVSACTRCHRPANRLGRWQAPTHATALAGPIWGAAAVIHRGTSESIKETRPNLETHKQRSIPPELLLVRQINIPRPRRRHRRLRGSRRIPSRTPCPSAGYSRLSS